MNSRCFNHFQSFYQLAGLLANQADLCPLRSTTIYQADSDLLSNSEIQKAKGFIIPLCTLIPADFKYALGSQVYLYLLCFIK